MLDMNDLTCPSCRRAGGLIVLYRDRGAGLVLARCCEDLEYGQTCGQPVLWHGAAFGGEVLRVIYPPMLNAPTDPAIPSSLAFSLTEARLCHDAGAHTAATVMVRRILEAMCADQGISDKTSKGAPRGLKSKLEELRDKTDFIPGRLFNWAMHLKSVGDEGAHDVTSSATLRDAADAIELAEHMLDHLYVQTARYERHVRDRERRKLPAVDVRWTFESDSWDGGTWTLKAHYPQQDNFQSLVTRITMSDPGQTKRLDHGKAFFEQFRESVAAELFQIEYRLGKLNADDDQQEVPPWAEITYQNDGFNSSGDPPF